MRRIALILTTIAAAAGVWAMTAAAGDEHTYKVELDNAFGLVPGSDVKVAGVIAGSIKGLDVNAAKRAVVTIGVHGPFSDFRADATCSSEPQSLIAEYFIDCEPGHSPTASNGFVPVKNTTTTVANDLVQNTLRQPFKQRFQLIINEFGTALAGNPQNLNDAIRRGAPALRATRQALDILGRQSKMIRDLNANSDRIIGLLAQNRSNVIRFIHNAGDAAAISASRRVALQQDFHLLPDFLAQLQPNLAKLGGLADQQTPLLTDLNAVAPQLTRLTKVLPPFNNASKPSLVTLGAAAKVGKGALTHSRPVISQLQKAGVSAAPAAKSVANFLKSLDDPKMAVEQDTRAYAKCDSSAPAGTTAATCGPYGGAGDNCRATPQDQLPAAISDPSNPRKTIVPSTTPPQCNAFQPTGSSGGGYSGLEGLLNYAYWQTTAINQFDHIGHLLHFILYEVAPGHGFGPCAPFNAHSGVPDKASSDTSATTTTYTTDPNNANRCVSWLGTNQPDVTQFTHLPPYPGQVCPASGMDASGIARTGVAAGTDLPGTLFAHVPNTAICTPGQNTTPASRRGNPVEMPASQQQSPSSPLDLLGGKGGSPLGLPKLPDVGKGLSGLLDVPKSVLNGIGGSSTRNLGVRRRRTDPATTGDLLNFLFGS